MWVEPDLNMPDGESLVRQLLVGKRWYKQAYGVDVRIGWNPDSFGYTWQLPQIYKKSGIDYFVTQKMTWNDTNQLPFKLFWWESPDGSKVLTYFPHDYVNTEPESGAAVRRSGYRAGASPGHDGDDGPLRRWRSRRRADAGDSGRGLPLECSACREWGSRDAEVRSSARRRATSRRSRRKIAPESPTWNYQSIAKGYTAAGGRAGQGGDSDVG